eukprot:GHVS01091529.1.p1 GENE.GHVS01091529.1~~GHVS01091529.1.p1  ORF type:complete len:535 (+),score=174.26 GHVS01091529.1:54-1607(+)
MAALPQQQHPPPPIYYPSSLFNAPPSSSTLKSYQLSSITPSDTNSVVPSSLPSQPLLQHNSSSSLSAVGIPHHLPSTPTSSTSSLPQQHPPPPPFPVQSQWYNQNISSHIPFAPLLPPPTIPSNNNLINNTNTSLVWASSQDELSPLPHQKTTTTTFPTNTTIDNTTPSAQQQQQHHLASALSTPPYPPPAFSPALPSPPHTAVPTSAPLPSFSSRLKCLEQGWWADLAAGRGGLPRSVFSLVLPQEPPHDFQRMANNQMAGDGSDDQTDINTISADTINSSSSSSTNDSTTATTTTGICSTTSTASTTDTTTSTTDSTTSSSTTSSTTSSAVCVSHDEVTVTADGVIHVPLLLEGEREGQQCLCLSREEWNSYTKDCDTAVNKLMLTRDCWKHAHEWLRCGDNDLWSSEIERVAALDMVQDASRASVVCRQDKALHIDQCLVGVDDIMEEMRQQKEAIKLEQIIRERQMQVKQKETEMEKGRKLLKDLVAAHSELTLLNNMLSKNRCFSVDAVVDD